MKMTKKFLLGGAVLLAATMMFTGCPKTVGNDFIDFSEAFDSKTKANATGSIDYTNETDTDNRGMALLRTKHEGMFAKIALNELNENSTNPGVMGLVFGLTEKKDDDGNKLYDFYLVGIRNDNGNLRTYLSKYTNISEDQFDDDNFGAKPNATTGASEKELQKITTYSNYTRNADNKNMEVAIKINPNDDGSYTIDWYNADDLNCADLVDKNASLTKIGPESFTITKKDTGYSKKDDLNLKIGFYANVYSTKNNGSGSMKGKWYLADLEGNPILPDYDDTVASPLFN